MSDMKDARDLFAADLMADQENRLEAMADLKFLAGEQWDAQMKAARDASGRPCMTFNRLKQYANSVTGDMRLNPPSIKVRPVDNGADVKTAEIYTGLIRNIEAQTDGAQAYLTGATNAVHCGEGWFGLTYDYVEDSFDMELGFRRISNPFAVVCDAGATDPTRADAKHMFVTDLYTQAEFKARWPKASMAGFDSGNTEGWGQWKQGDFVRVAEYWKRSKTVRKLVLCVDQFVLDVTDMEDADAAAIIQMHGGMARERKAEGSKVTSCLMSGMEELDDATVWPGRYIPLIRVAGQEINVGERIVRSGIIRDARAPQQLYNFQRTAMAEMIAMAPKAKWLVTPAMIAGVEAHWSAANTSNQAYLPYNADKTAGVPQRIAPDMPNANLVQDAQLAAMDIEATIGIYREGLGRESNAISGKAILSRQREGDTGTFLYMDNLATAVTQAGRVLIDVLPKVYDTPRIVRTLGEDGSEDFVEINTTLPDGTKANDISAGRYDVVASVGPSFSTRREEARESMMAFMQAVPQAAAVTADLMAKAMDWPGADGISDRLHKMAVAQGIAEPTDEEKQEMAQRPQQPQQPDPNLLLAQAEQMKAQAAMAKVQTDAQIAQAHNEIEHAKIDLERGKLGLTARKDQASAQNAAQQTQLKQVQVAADVATKIADHRAGRHDAAVNHHHRMVDRGMKAAMPPQQFPPQG
jgi:hypothetical protein